MSRTSKANLTVNPNELYETPGWVTRLLLKHLDIKSFVKFIEPACGEGAIIKELVGAGAYPELVHGFEIQHDLADRCQATYTPSSIYRSDFLKQTKANLRPFVGSGPKLWITNPPFSKSEMFARKCLEMRDPGDVIALLLSVSFGSGISRQVFHFDHPSHERRIPKRPSFGLNKEGKKGTDQAEYAWYVWGDGHEGKWSILPLVMLPAVNEAGKRTRGKMAMPSTEDEVRKWWLAEQEKGDQTDIDEETPVTPPIDVPVAATVSTSETPAAEPPKRKRGRPRKNGSNGSTKIDPWALAAAMARADTSFDESVEEDFGV